VSLLTIVAISDSWCAIDVTNTIGVDNILTTMATSLNSLFFPKKIGLIYQKELKATQVHILRACCSVMLLKTAVNALTSLGVIVALTCF
jgi:hypothetical protein